MSGSSSARPDSRSKNPGLLKRAFTNESGQLAVLIALIFQVLFILFAMVINIGLIIHDKINLQNAVDLGAYYGAERQAEAMNEIAHINYQIRQDYKLMTWRYRVMGSFGSLAHPARSQGVALTESAYAVPSVSGACGSNGCPPSVCMGHSSWAQTTGGNSNLCDKAVGFTIPKLEDVKFLGIVPGLLDITGDLNGYKATNLAYCGELTGFDWKLAAMYVIGFRLSVAQRMKMIAKIANDISQADWNDALGGSVHQGVYKTVLKNLTAANADPSSFSNSGVTIVNGLTLGGCGTEEDGLPHWLKNIYIEPHMPYLNAGQAGTACEAVSLNDFAAVASDGIILTDADPTHFWQDQVAEPQGLAHSSRGVEKNPWCMAYIGVKAQTHPRKPFAPFGQVITMEAKAFAAPFGGRIGPWDKDTWNSGAEQSSGNQIDAVAVPRGLSIDTAKATPDATNPYFPNYSRFPGDKLGLRSTLALGLFRDEFFNLYQQGKLSMTNYESVGTAQTTADSLAWNTTLNNAPTERTLEVGAVSPDLFDAAYYSVDSDYYDDYFTKRNWAATSIVAMSDEGYRIGGDSATLHSNIAYQIKRVSTHPDVATYGFYLVPKIEDLLTGWTQGKAVDYDAESPSMIARFGKCQLPVDMSSGLPAVPGNCIAGGRVGYSVRILHKAYLNSAAHQLGGADSGQGPLQNAPGETL